MMDDAKIIANFTLLTYLKNIIFSSISYITKNSFSISNQKSFLH